MFRSSGIRASLIVLVLLVSGTTFAFSASAASGPRTDDWTVALYVGADNNLEVAWDDYSLPALLGIPASKHVNIVALVDRLSTQGLELIEFSGDTYEVVDTWDEMNTGDGATFALFLDTVEELYPAENMCIIPWNHGGSWRGFCSDDSSTVTAPSGVVVGDIIRMNEFSDALNQAALQIDVLAFDACIMSAVEVSYEAYTTGMVTYMVASEMYVPFDGFPYDLMFAPLAEDPTATPEQLLDLMLLGWDGYYHSGRQLNLVVTNVEAMGASLPAYRAWSDALISGLDENRAAYEAAVTAAIGSDYAGPMPDVHDLCEQLIINVDDVAVQDACRDVMAAVEETVIALHTGGWAQDMHGLSIWWLTFDPTYWYHIDQYDEGVAFAEDAGWSAFLRAYNGLP